LMPYFIIRSFSTLFNACDIVTYLQPVNSRKMLRMPRNWSTIFAEYIRRRCGRMQMSFGTSKRMEVVDYWNWWVEERHQLDDLFCYYLLHIFCLFVWCSTNWHGTEFTTSGSELGGSGASSGVESAELSQELFPILFPSLCENMQRKRLARQEGDNVMARTYTTD
jgi:hypothetical protein